MKRSLFRYYGLIMATGLLLHPAIANAQTGVLAKWSNIPPYIDMKALGDISGERISLKWDCGSDTVATTLRLGTPIVRQIELNGKAIDFPDTINASDTLHIRGTAAVDTLLGSFRGTIYIDKKDPSRLIVNPYLWTKVPARLKCGGVHGDSPRTITGDSLRERVFYYKLKNRQTVAFTTVSIGLSGVVIPIRYRPGYTLNGVTVGSDVADAITLGALFGAGISRLRYQYVKDAENTLTESSRITIGPFAALGKGTVEKKSSLTATTPDTVGHSFPTLSVGAAIMMNVRGVDLGVFAAPEFGIGASAKNWDYDRRLWWGFGLSFNGGK